MNSLFKFDNDFNSAAIIGTDEAGRGPGAGGVFASAVCFVECSDELITKLTDLNDSKKLSRNKREELYEIILENTINSTVCIEVEEIEKINILNASLKAMKLACENVITEKGKGEKESRSGILARQQDISVLVDGNKPIKLDSDHCSRLTIHPIVKGDSKSASIAAASILAKVSRDKYMQELHERFPQYNWKQNAGYLTAEHLSAIEKYGITPHHRKSFLKNWKEPSTKPPKQKTKQLSLLN